MTISQRKDTSKWAGVEFKNKNDIINYLLDAKNFTGEKRILKRLLWSQRNYTNAKLLKMVKNTIK